GWIKRRPVHASDSAASFLDDERAGSDIPRLQMLLPERFEAAGGDIAEIERLGAEASHCACAAQEVPEQLDQFGPFLTHGVGKTGDEQRIDQRRRLRCAQRAPVEICALATLRREQLPA